MRQGSPCGAVANVLDGDIVVSVFKLQTPYYVHFRTKTIGKDVNPQPPPKYGSSSTIAVILQWSLCHLITQEGWYAIETKKPEQISKQNANQM